MRVIVNGLAALKPKTGVGHYVSQLHASLVRQFPADRFTLYPGEPVAGWVGRNLPRGGAANGPATAWAAAKRTGIDTLKHVAKTAVGVHFAGTCRAGNVELYHEPNFIPFAADVPTVITVHDLSVMRHPEWHPADRVKHHRRHFPAAVRRAAHIVVVSHAVKAELCADFGVAESRVTAVHNGVGPEFRPHSPTEVADVRGKLGLPAKYFLCVGTVEPRKNLLAVLRAFAELPARVRAECPLVVAGPWGWKADAERAFFANTAGPAGARHVGYVAAADLPGLYAGAAGLLYPSFYEGFGLPPAEMLATGGAVVCSREAAAVREVVGGHGTFVDAADVSGWRAAMQKLVDDPAPVRPIHEFSWDRAAAETAAVYRRVLGVPLARAA